MEDLIFSTEVPRKWYKDKPGMTWDDLAGMTALKARLRWEAADILSPANPAPARSYFFYGLPGGGKAYIVQLLIRELMDAGYRYLSLRGTDIHSAYVGEGEKHITLAFEEAMNNAPCVLWFDNIDSFCPNHSSSDFLSYTRRLSDTFLECLDKLLCSGKQVILLTCSDVPHLVEEALIRHSRKILIPLPDEAARMHHFAKAFDFFSMEEGFSLQDMVDATANHGYYDLRRLSESIALHLKDAAIEKYRVIDAHGKPDWEATNRAAVKALTEGHIRLTRAMFDKAHRENPPSNKATFLCDLEAFEKRFQS